MANIPNIEADTSSVVQRAESLARKHERTKSLPLIALVLALFPVNAGVLIYTAKNAADVRESRETLSALKRSIDSLKTQVDKQGRFIARNAKAEDLAIIRSHTESLHKTLNEIDDRMRSSFFAPPSAGSIILSAPGKEVTQRLHAQTGFAPVGSQSPDHASAAIDTEDGTGTDLPRYERSVSPEGKLILRKVQ